MSFTNKSIGPGFMIALFILAAIFSAVSAKPDAIAASQSNGQVRFAVIGDYGKAGQPELDVASLVKSWNPDLIITTGDNNYPDGTAQTIDANIGQYYREFIYPYVGSYGPGAATNRFFPALGNHDWNTGTVQPYLNYFTLPGNERYYDYVWGPVHFFVLDSDIQEPDGNTISSIQAVWLQGRLAASTSPWKIVYLHHPPYSSGKTHGSNTNMQWPYSAWGADAVLAGHDHTYERIFRDGIPYFVNGLSGHATRYPFGKPVSGSRVRYNSDYGAMLVTAVELQIVFQFFTRTGTLIDSYTMNIVPTLTPSPTATFTPTDTPTITATSTPSSTPTPSDTPTPTDTPTVTPTPRPSAHIDVNIGGTFQDQFLITYQSGVQRSYTGVDSGPVKMTSTDPVPIIASLRVLWKELGQRTSYSEMMGLPKEGLSTEYWFPWYNNLSTASMDQGFRIGNVDAISSHTIEVWVGTTQLDSLTLGPGASTRTDYPVDNGPVRIVCTTCINPDQKIIAALRVIWKEPGQRTSYSEMMGLPKEQLSTEYWFPWYNNLATDSMDQGFRIANVDAVDTTIKVMVGNTESDIFNLAAGASTRVSYDVDNGPIRIYSMEGKKIIAALRVIWKEPGQRTSYSEMMGLPKEQLSREYWFPWYNNLSTVSMDQGFRIANVDIASSHTVEVWVGITQLDTITLNPGASTRVGYPVNDGPIRIVCATCLNSDQKIIAALRVIWKEPGQRMSYSEMMGLPMELLSSEYWFPWYNNATTSMDQGFRVSVP